MIANDIILGLGRTSIAEGTTEYEPEVEEVALEDAQDIPSYMSPCEYMMSVAYEQEFNLNKLNMAILAEEYVYLRENGQEMVEESAKDTAKNVAAKAKGMIDKLWGHIQSFFKKVLEQCKKLDQRDALFIKMYQKAAKEGVSCEIETTKSLAETSFDTIVKKTEAIYKNIKDEVENSKTMNVEKHNPNTNLDALKKNAVTRIFNNGQFDGKSFGTSADMYIATILTDYEKYPKNTKKYKITAATAIEELGKAKDSTAAVKTAYNSTKKVVNSMYKQVKKLDKADPEDDLYSKIVNVNLQLINYLGGVLTNVNSAEVKIINMKRKVMKQAILACAKKSKNGLEKNAKDDANSIDGHREEIEDN